jgi:hypothetical protein
MEVQMIELSKKVNPSWTLEPMEQKESQELKIVNHQNESEDNSDFYKKRKEARLKTLTVFMSSIFFTALYGAWSSHQFYEKAEQFGANESVAIVSAMKDAINNKTYHSKEGLNQAFTKVASIAKATGNVNVIVETFPESGVLGVKVKNLTNFQCEALEKHLLNLDTVGNNISSTINTYQESDQDLVPDACTNNSELDFSEILSNWKAKDFN